MEILKEVKEIIEKLRAIQSSDEALDLINDLEYAMFLPHNQLQEAKPPTSKDVKSEGGWRYWHTSSPLGNTGDYMSDHGITNDELILHADIEYDEDELMDICNTLNASQLRQPSGWISVSEYNELKKENENLYKEMENSVHNDTHTELLLKCFDLRKALLDAKETIKAHHGPVAWDIYDKQSPEMKRINNAIELAPHLPTP